MTQLYNALKAKYPTEFTAAESEYTNTIWPAVNTAITAGLDFVTVTVAAASNSDKYLGYILRENGISFFSIEHLANDDHVISISFKFPIHHPV